MITRFNAKYVKDVLRFMNVYKVNIVSGENIKIIKKGDNYDFFYKDLIYNDLSYKELVDVVKESKYYGEDIV